MAVAAGQIITAADLAWNSGSVALTNDTNTATISWQQWGTQTIQFDDPGVKVMVRAWLIGRLVNHTDTGSNGAGRVQISTDGGVTFTPGSAAAVDVGTSVGPRAITSSMGYLSVVPTGDVIIKAELSVSDISISGEDGSIMADIFPI